ncbi:peptide/nickel transport system permease protein [Pseudonocardia ammonioxydans]|uniref:Peptide/nickel transport system permease protein n=1 Tax=Pseudonocardia ammonioxydans TaxID=260086 RepID=A0A1I4Y124_PSUAM|nr:ABC transporter permease subunit [Pseudonocardia ammonioxydans]SFN31333.1 peptide/nickel transport system permease protein [Pseudonocardia ammonioxydans]
MTSGRPAAVRDGPAPRPAGTALPRTSWRRAARPVALSRVVAAAGVVFLIGSLPWLSQRSPELAVLRARSAEQEATPEALASIRAELGLDAGPWGVFGNWLGGALTGDLGTSWVSGQPVLPAVLGGLGVSLTLMGFALVVAALVTAALLAPVLRRGLTGAGAGTVGNGGGLAAALTALPEFLLAAVLLVTVAVGLGWLPPYGWAGPQYAVLPALALGLPAGGLVGRLLAEAVASAFAEPWVGTWQTAGLSRRRVAGAVVRRALPSVLPQIGLVVVGTTGGAVAVEEVFAIPGTGRTTLGAAESLDLPLLQGGVLALLLVAVVAGALAQLARRLILGRAARTGDVPVASVVTTVRRRRWVLPGVAGGLLLVVVAAGLLRDPYTSAHPRLAAPSLALPMGSDAAGRDLLARAGHGALLTAGTALAVVALSLLLGVLIGLAPRLSTGPAEIANAAPPVLAGLVVAAVLGPSAAGAAIGVALVGWAPLAAHTAALVSEIRAQPHVRILPVLGVGPARATAVHVLPAAAGPLVRHAMLRLPGTALALASLGFLGLGPQPPSPEWGRLLADGMPYVERAPWVVAAPAGMLVLVAVLAVSLASAGRTTTRRGRPGE